MKQIIIRYIDNNISCKYYLNDIGQWHGLYIDYLFNNTVIRKRSYINGKVYGLNTWYDRNNKIEKQKYIL